MGFSKEQVIAYIDNLVDKQKAALEEEKEKYTQLQEENEKLINERDNAVETAKAELQESVNSLTDTVEALKNEKESLALELEDLNNENKALGESNEKLQNEKNELFESIKSIKAQLNDYINKEKSVNEKIEGLENENKVLALALEREAAALAGEVHGQNTGEAQRAAQQLQWCERLLQQQPAEQHREYRLKAHKQSGDGGVGVFLGDDLQGIGNTAGADTCVQNGHGRTGYIGKGYVLCNKRGNKGQYGTDEELYA